MKVIELNPDGWQEGRGYRKNRLLSAGELRQTGALLQVVQVPPGEPPSGGHIPPHRHATSVEVYVVRRGECELIVNGERHTLRPGDVILMEPGDVHELINRSEEVFELLVFKTNVGESDTAWENAQINVD